jgi:hypothetical protein
MLARISAAVPEGACQPSDVCRPQLPYPRVGGTLEQRWTLLARTAEARRWIRIGPSRHRYQLYGLAFRLNLNSKAITNAPVGMTPSGRLCFDTCCCDAQRARAGVLSAAASMKLKTQPRKVRMIHARKRLNFIFTARVPHAVRRDLRTREFGMYRTLFGITFLLLCLSIAVLPKGTAMEYQRPAVGEHHTNYAACPYYPSPVHCRVR